MKEHLRRNAPLADRMRPRNLDEFVGQEDLVGPGKVLRRAIETDRVPSMILWGPPGSGKTTLARIIASQTKAHFEQISAVTSGVAELRKLMNDARERLSLFRQKTIVFIDEIHRFNKAQQDALLPYVENGTIVLIGATTENPYFSVNPALISRTRVLRLRQLEDDDIRLIINRALEDKESGLGGKYALEPAALEHLIMVANGDSRAALNALELAAELATPNPDGQTLITLEDALNALQQRAITYDRDGDQHYDTISAFIKSMRGSDPDAAVYWLAKMVAAGEDPGFIARRIVICASEDVGNADPMALLVATSAALAVEQIGMPEGRIPLAQAAIYVACAPKSNASYLAIESALKDVMEGPPAIVPLHLRDASYKGAKKLGHGTTYKYPHDYPGYYVTQQYMPDGLEQRQYYIPKDSGQEALIKQRLAARKSPNSTGHS